MIFIIGTGYGVNSAHAEQFDIGPGFQYENLCDFNWDSLSAGDVVQIHYREKPYYEKLIISRSGAKNNPIEIRGVPDNEGNLPIIDGKDARQFQGAIGENLDRRALILLGGSRPADYVEISGLEIRNANNVSHFWLQNHRENYANNAAGILVWQGQHIKIKKCTIHSCCMGVQTSYYPETNQFYLGLCRIYNNGDFTRTHWAHNVYICARSSLIEGNWFGELYSDGNNIKDRSNKTVIRYNWIEGGMSHQIDLVESKKYPIANAYVYGNVIIHGEKVKNPKMIFFGGDLVDNETGKSRGLSRSGTLYFFNNTVISTIKTNDREPLILISRNDCSAYIRNNVLLGRKKIWSGPGIVSGNNNFFSNGAETENFTNNFYGGFEQFESSSKDKFMPRKMSRLRNAGSSNIPTAVNYMPSSSLDIKRRKKDVRIDIGAFER